MATKKDPPGLCDSTTGTRVPLRSVGVKVDIQNFTAQVEVEHRYRNTGNNPIEAIFRFPVDPLSAVYHFEAEVNGKRLIGEVHEQEEAQEMYSDAISAGKGAYLLEQETEELFTMNVGNLPPQKEVLLKFSYVTELTMEGNDIVKFRLPETVAPFTDLAPQSEPTARQKKKKEAHKNLDLEDEVSYTFKLELNATMPFYIKKLNCSMEDGAKTNIKKNTATIVSKGQLEKDFTLGIELNEPHKPVFTREVLPDELQNKSGTMAPVAYALNFIPNLKYNESECEVIFLLDRSGSMMGDSISKLRLTMYQVLKHLPNTVRLNIIGFGSSYKVVFPQSIRCDYAGIHSARQHIATIEADMGGTELLLALQKLYADKATNRQIFLITDGEVSNKPEVRALVAKNSSSARMFTFGIGYGVDKDLITTLAKEGKGEAIFIDTAEGIEDSIIAQVHRALSPAFPQIKLSCLDAKGNKIESQSIQQSPLRLPPIFNKQLYTVYLLVSDPTIAISQLILEASGKAGDYEYPIDSKHIISSDGALVHRLAARVLIRELSESGLLDADKKAKIIKLALAYNLASEYTSFLIVEDRDHATEGTMEVQKVPTKKKSENLKKKSAPAPIAAKSVSRFSGGGYRGGGGGGGSSSSSDRRKRNKLEKFAKSKDSKKQKIAPEVTSSPFGVATPSPANLADSRCLTHVIFGPTISMTGLTCWLDSLLGLLMTLRLNELELKGNESTLVKSVVKLCTTWAGASDVWWFRKELSDARRAVWEAYQAKGFTFGHKHCVVYALQVLIKELGNWNQNALVLDTGNPMCNTLTEINNATQQYIICLNSNNARLPSLRHKSYKLYSFISYEVIDELTSHYVCAAMSDSGYFIYDNLLAIAPGAHQGGHVPANAPCYKSNLRQLKSQVPIFVLHKV